MPPAPLAPTSSDDAPRARALGRLRRHGWNATAFQSLEPGFAYWFDDALDACVAYADTGRCYVVAGAPIAPADALAEAAARFVAAAARAGRRTCFFAVEDRFVAAAPALASIQIGEQPVWDPCEWPATLASSRSLREQLRRARAKGVVVRALAAGELDASRPAIERLILRWEASRAMAPMGFLVAVEPFAFADERRYFVAERAGTLVGFLAAVPVHARGGWLLEDFLRDASAPNGTVELLVDAAMRAIAAEGSRYATLGLAPLSGPVRGWLRVARDVSSALYDFRGIQAFKTRLRPSRWEPIHLAYPRRATGAVAVYDALTAFARGSLVRFGVQTVLRGPTIVVQTLATLLVPWTIALAAVDTRRWFPRPWVQLMWVGFDVAVTLALFVLARRWRPWLATLLATAVTADAVTTVLEALVFNAPRAAGVGTWAVLFAACAAPSLAAVVLWNARAARRAALQRA